MYVELLSGRAPDRNILRTHRPTGRWICAVAARFNCRHTFGGVQFFISDSGAGDAGY